MPTRTFNLPLSDLPVLGAKIDHILQQPSAAGYRFVSAFCTPGMLDGAGQQIPPLLVLVFQHS